MKTRPRFRYLKIILGVTIKKHGEERDIVESFYLVFHMSFILVF